MKKIVLLWVLFLPGILFARFQIGLNFTVIVPQDEFKENVDELGLGGSGDFVYYPGASPLGFGAGLGFAVYGSESRREPFSTTIPDVEVEVNTTNNILFGHFTLQYKPFQGPIQPYLEGLFGFNYLFTETKIRDVDHDYDDDDDEIASSTNLSDFTGSYGVGGGLLFKLVDLESGDGPGKTGKLFLDLKVRSLSGGEGEYLKKGSIKRANGKVSYDVQNSDISMLTYHIGVVFQF